MALTIHAPLPFAGRTHYLLHTALPSHGGPGLTIRSQKPTPNLEPSEETSSLAATPKKASASGRGFGSSTSSSSNNSDANTNPNNRKKSKSTRERASVIRRVPVEKPALVSEEDKARGEEQRKNESAFLLAWLGLGGIILVEGIVLAASGFLPEKWDKFFVKYLYPSFTPTVVLFVAGTVVYGVLKYLQNDNPRNVK